MWKQDAVFTVKLSTQSASETVTIPAGQKKKLSAATPPADDEPGGA
jgi:hypothetical protein